MSRRAVRYKPQPPDQKTRASASVRTQRRDNVSYSEPNVSVNDIMILKKELNDLLRQRSLMKAKIQRLNDTIKSSNGRPKVTNQQVASNLQKEMKKIEQYNQSRRAEIASIMSSDLAAEITEQQQESLILYQEINRINKRKREADRELAETNAQLEQVSQQYSPENLRLAQRKVAALEQEIAVQQRRNEKLRKQIEEADEERDRAEVESDENLKKQIEILEQKIAAEQQNNEDLDKEIEETRKKYDEEIQRLQKEL